jgi:2-polyprenyl-3-methyl-5-hydroxy-6-metoxy-1,4-benzoquinol methylase
MNRKQRRAAPKQPPPAAGGRSASARDPIAQLFAEAVDHERQRQLNAAARAYERLLLLEPEHAEASNNLGRVLQAQGKRAEASACYARALTLMPQLFDQYAGICATLVSLLPPLGAAMAKASAAWPERLGVAELLGSGGLAAIAADPLLRCMLQSTPVRDISLERLLTALRAALLDVAIAGEPATGATLAFCCALAKQCFINEYVFATTPAEDARVDQLKATLASESAISAMPLVVLAMYLPLHALPDAQMLLARNWPDAVDGVLTQQLREPDEERRLRATIPRLTPIEDDVSQRVRQQYEENPYPRWVQAAGPVEPVAIDHYLRTQFPAVAFTSLEKTEALDILVAGTGTGWQAIGLAQKFLGARILAVDLSLSSLSFAKRSTPARLRARIDYAQADILQLGSLDRRFDVVDASGVLHHMADPLEGMRILLTLLQPNGLMHLGLYSESGRKDVVAARAFIAEHGFGSTSSDIRRCRQELLATPLRSVSRFTDFFSTSECRDLLFHVQERRVTIPAIKDFLAAHGLRFLGFEFDAATQHTYRAQFAGSGWSPTDLDRWHALETDRPDMFSGMYQFWVQKR